MGNRNMRRSVNNFRILQVRCSTCDGEIHNILIMLKSNQFLYSTRNYADSIYHPKRAVTLEFSNALLSLVT